MRATQFREGRLRRLMYCCSILIAWSVMAVGLAQGDESLRLRVSDSGRYLVDGNGQPFFWLGDTGWTMFSSLSLEDAEYYLENRREKGFNVIQCIIAHWSRNDVRANPDGQRPWLSDDPATPNQAYFEHVDAIVKLAEEKGIILAMLPAWGDFVTENEVLTADNAGDYGLWLGFRYQSAPNVVWVLGGDRLPDGHGDVFRELAGGLAQGDGGSHLMTYHPRGGGHSSSEFFHDEHWLSFNMIQSSHSIDYPNYQDVLGDYSRAPTKPTLDGEPRYENIISGLRREGVRMDDHDIRKAAYNAVLSGALGHTYGCNGVFQFYKLGEESRWQPGIEWQAALDLPGAFDMTHLKNLMLARAWHKLVPDQSLIRKGGGEGGTYVPAARSDNGQFAYIYIPVRQTVTVDMSKITGEGAKASWYNPRTGESTEAGEFDNSGRMEFTPPSGPEDPDYVLVLESAGPETTPPTITRIIAGGDPNRVVIMFSEPVERQSAESAANYQITPGITVGAALLAADQRSVSLITGALTDGATYTVAVSEVRDRAIDPNPVAPETQKEFVFLASPPRVVEGLQALYTFDEGQGATVDDVSGVGDPAHLEIEDEASVSWLPAGLALEASTIIASRGPAAKIIQACQESNEITIEAWVKPANTEQDGPARIVTLSADTGIRNFTLGQEADTCDVRLRTTETSDNGVPPIGHTPAGSLTTELSHVVYTRDALGMAFIYINGEEAVAGDVGGDLSNWDQDFRFGLANEFTMNRTWLGELRLVAVYSRALTQAEVAKNLEAGAGPPAQP